MQCADCQMHFSLYLVIRAGERPSVERSSNVRLRNGKYVHLCGGPLRLLAN